MKKTSAVIPKNILINNQTNDILKRSAQEIGKKFYHHTTKESVFNILRPDEKGNRFFFLRNILEMNDRDESKLHKTNGKKIHSFCTCCTKYEKIPLWYMYSGICGDGARIGITPGKMLNFINCNKK
jgi:hypothetical protein